MEITFKWCVIQICFLWLIDFFFSYQIIDMTFALKDLQRRFLTESNNLFEKGS